MQKQTAFYVASAAFAATILFTDDKASAASIVVQDGYQLLEKQNTVQTFDLAKEQTTRTINFSLPVDATTVKANDNIVLFDVTASEKVTVTAKVASNKTSVDVKLAEGVTYKEGHEYRLLIGNTIKNVATKTESLKQAIQFNYKTINVTAPPVAKPEGEQAANGTLSGTISSITASNVTIGDKSYSMSTPIAAFVAANKEALAGADIKATLTDGNITSIEELTIVKDSAKLVGTDDAGVVKNTTITVAAENVTLHKLQFANLFVSNTVKQTLTVSDSIISGKMQTLTERITQSVVEEQHATTLTIRFINSVVVEMLISRLDVKSEISGTSKVTLISVKANTNISIDPAVILPKLSIADGVTNVQLNASIAEVEVRTNNDVAITGAGNFDKLSITTEKNVSLNITGTVKEIALQNEDATMTVGDKVTIESVKIPETMTPEQVITNYENVKEKLEDKIVKSELEEFVAAKFVETDVENVMELSVVGVSKNANVSYQHYSSRYMNEAPNVGDTLTNAQKWTKGTTVPYYFDRDYYIFVTDKNGVITDRFEVYEQSYGAPVTATQTGSTLTLMFAAYTKEHDVAQYVDTLYIADGTSSEIVDLTKHQFMYDEHGRPSIAIDISKYSGVVSYHIEMLGDYYSELQNFSINNPNYTKAIYDFAIRAKQHNSYTFYSLLQHSNYELVDYVSPAGGDTYKVQQSTLSNAPSMRQQYVDAFSEKQYATVADIQQKVKDLHAASKPLLDAFNTYNAQMDAMYEGDTHNRLKADVTLEQINELKAKIEVNEILPQIDKNQLLLNHSNLTYAYYRMYNDLVAALTNEYGIIRDSVDEDTIDTLINKITDEVADNFLYKDWLLESLQMLKNDLSIQPFKKLENYNWRYVSDRLQEGVTPEQVTAAYTASLALAKNDTQKQRVEAYYSQMKYYYVTKELAKLSPTKHIEVYNLLQFNEGVTLTHVETIFNAFDHFNGSYESNVKQLKNVALKSVANSTLFNYVTYSDTERKYVLKDGVALETGLTFILAEMKKDENSDLSSQFRTIIQNVVNDTFKPFYSQDLMKEGVTKASIDTLYNTTLALLQGSNYEYDVMYLYNNTLYDYYKLQLSHYYEYPTTSYVSHLKEGTTSEQIEKLFADVNVDEYYNIAQLKNQALASIEVADALVLMKPNYWKYSGMERIVEGKSVQLINTVLELQKTVTNLTAINWLDDTLRYLSDDAFSSLKNSEAYNDGTMLREDVTIEQINEAYEAAKVIVNNYATEQTYKQYMYYYYAKEASKLLVQPILYSDTIQLLKDDVTTEQIDAVFAAVTFDAENADNFEYKVKQLKETMHNALAVRDLLKLFNGSKLADGVTTNDAIKAYKQLIQKESLHYAARHFVDNLVDRFVTQQFMQFRNDNWSSEADYLREDVTLADLQSTYDVVKGFNTSSVNEMYSEYQYHYYIQQVAALTGVNRISNVIAFKKDVSPESIDALFIAWKPEEATTYYDERINSLIHYMKLSEKLQPMITLLHEEYVYSNEPLFAEDVTLTQFNEAYKQIMNVTDDEAVKQWLRNLLTNDVMPKLFRDLQNESYENDATRLKEDVTLEDIQSIYDALVPITEANRLSSLQQERDKLQYYYYLREVATLTGVTTVTSTPVAFKKDTTLEDLDKLFSTWDIDTETSNYYTRYITTLAKNMKLSVALQPILQLLSAKYTNYSEPLLAEGATLQQLVTAYEKTKIESKDEEIQQWLSSFVTNTLIEKTFGELTSDSWSTDAERLKEEVTLEDIRERYTALLPILTDNEKYRLEDERYEKELYYYVRETEKVTGLTDSISAPALFTKEASIESIEKLFETWDATVETSSYYASSITNLQKYVTLSASMQPLLELLHANYRYGDELLAEGATLEQFVEGYKEAFDSTDDANIQKELRYLLMNVVMPKLFDTLLEYKYDMHKYILREDVTVETIETLYDTLLPIVAKEDRPTLLSKKYELQYVYYTDQIEELTGVTNSIYSPIVFEKEVSIESIEALFKEWDAKAEYNDYRAKEITNLAKNVIISANIQPILTLLHENYENYYGSELLKDGVTLEQFVTAYEKAFNSTEHEASKEWMKNLVSSHFVRKAFNHLQSDNYSNDFEYAKDDVTIANIRSISEELAPILSEQDAATVQQKQYRLEYSYYLKQLVKLAPGIQEDVYESYYKLADDVTLEKIEAALSDFEYTGDEHYYFENILTLKETLITSYSVKELLALVDNIDAEQPFKEYVTVEELKTAYEAIVARGDDTATGKAQQLLFNYIDALGETVLYSMRIEENYYGELQPLATTEEVNGVIEKFTALQAFIVPENLAGAINQLNERKALLAFSALLVEGTNNVLKDDTTLQHIIDIYNTMDAELKDTDIHYEVDYLFRTYVDRYYQQQIQTVTGSEYKSSSRYVFANTPTLEQVNAIFSSMAALEDHKSLLTTVQTMQKQVLKNYYIQDLLALTQNNSWSRFKTDATVEQIQAAYDKAVASENADVLSDVKQLFRSHSNNIVSAIGYTQYNYDTQSYYVELRSSVTPEQIQTVYDELTTMQNIVNHEEIAQWIASLTTKLPVREEKVMINATEVVQPTVIKPETLVPAHPDLAEQELVELLPEMIVTDKLEEYNSLQSVKVPVVAKTAVSLEQLASYTDIASFITEDDYGFTIGSDVDREQLQMFAEELEAALEGMEGEERLQLLLQLVTDMLAEPVAFVPFSLA